jgi:hypothetical protein
VEESRGGLGSFEAVTHVLPLFVLGLDLAGVVIENLYFVTALLPTLGPIGPFIRGGKNTVFCSYSCRPRLDQGTVFAAVTINKDTSFAVIVVN